MKITQYIFNPKSYNNSNKKKLPLNNQVSQKVCKETKKI